MLLVLINIAFSLNKTSFCLKLNNSKLPELKDGLFALNDRNYSSSTSICLNCATTSTFRIVRVKHTVTTTVCAFRLNSFSFKMTFVRQVRVLLCNGFRNFYTVFTWHIKFLKRLKKYYNIFHYINFKFLVLNCKKIKK